MPKLTLVMGRTPIQVFELSQPIIQIGRGEGMELVIDNISVSRRQCEIRDEGRYWKLRDLESSNGTFLNGVRLAESQRLKPGDEISFGKFSLFFERELDAPLAEARIAPGTPRHNAPGTYYLGAEEVERLEQMVAAKRRAHLEWEAAGTTGTHFLNGAAMRVGPDEGAELRIATAPPKGLLIARGPQGFEVRNLARWIDFTPMKVNGRRRRRAPLQSGDRVQIRGLRLTFHDEIR
jgi:pSer/pThr/pTyr-binding forkhead associated (FHA) protein